MYKLRSRLVYYAILILLLVGAGNASADMIDIRLPDNVFMQSMGVTSTGFRGISNTFGVYGTATVYDFNLDGTYSSFSLLPLPGNVGVDAWISPDGTTIAGHSISATANSTITNWSSGSPTTIPGTNAIIGAVGNGGTIGGVATYPYAGTVSGGMSRISNVAGGVQDIRPGRAGGSTINGPTAWINGVETVLPQTNGDGLVNVVGVNNFYGEDGGKFAMWMMFATMNELFPEYNNVSPTGYFQGGLGNVEGAWGNSEEFGALLTKPDGITLWTFYDMCRADLGDACPLKQNPIAVNSFASGHDMWIYNGVGSSHIYLQNTPRGYDTSAVPEPGSFILVVTGVLSALALGRKKRPVQ